MALLFDAIEWAARDAAHAERQSASKTAPGPDISHEACACGAFGPWGDGTAFYCPKHVPPALRYAGAFFAEMMDE